MKSVTLLLEQHRATCKTSSLGQLSPVLSYMDSTERPGQPARHTSRIAPTLFRRRNLGNCTFAYQDNVPTRYWSNIVPSQRKLD